ncbi:retrovirus-related pol polyprotein from transposon TNT 1-94 [Tanacetum coccineum]
MAYDPSLAIVLDDSCILEKDMPCLLMGKIKDINASSNLYVILANEGFEQEYVESGFEVSDDDSRNKEHHKRDAKALFFIQQAVDESIFQRIAVATSSKQAWSILKTEFQGSSKVITVNQMRSYGEKITDEVIVAKVLKSLTPKFDHVVAAIEESKDLSNKQKEEAVEAFVEEGNPEIVLGIFPFAKNLDATDDLCWSKTDEAKFVKDTDEQVDYLFMAKGKMGEVIKEAWYIDSGCSHHMTGDKKKFKELDETVKSIVCLGDDKQLKIEGRGTVSVTPGESTSQLALFAEDPASVDEALKCDERIQGNALAAQKQWKVYKFDVKSAFLNAEFHEEDYVDQPPGFEKANENNKVYKLKKALYGLKQAPRAWYSKIDKKFQENGFERSMNEPTLYVKKEGMNGLVIVSLYVDDMIYIGSSLALISKFRNSMMNMFDMTDLGELKYFLGLEIVQNKTEIFMSQKKYIEDTLKKFNMSGCKMASTPMNLNEKFSVNDETEMANAIVYRSLIGRLIYLTHSRPDISYAVGVLSRFMHKPSKHYLGSARRILVFILGFIEDRRTHLFNFFTIVASFKLNQLQFWKGSLARWEMLLESLFLCNGQTVDLKMPRAEDATWESIEDIQRRFP